MQATLTLPLDTRGQLQAALDLLTAWDRRYLATHEVAPLLESGVRYEAEPIGRERWQTVPQTLRLGTGDCEDLACWYAAEVGGVAVPVRTATGWHVTVWTRAGVVDPSALLGMGHVR